MSQVLERALTLIDLVAVGNTSLADLTRVSGLTRSTTHRLLTTLVEYRYLELVNRQYRLGHRLFELGEKKRESFDFVTRLHPVVKHYADLTKDTIHLAVLEDAEIMLIERVFGSRELQIRSYVGMRNVALMTAVGKALVAHEDPKVWHELIERLPENSPKSGPEILLELEEARETGIASDFDECNVGTCGLAASFEVPTLGRVACSINGATTYFPEQRFAELVPVLRKMAEDLRKAL